MAGLLSARPKDSHRHGLPSPSTSCPPLSAGTAPLLRALPGSGALRDNFSHFAEKVWFLALFAGFEGKTVQENDFRCGRMIFWFGRLVLPHGQPILPAIKCPKSHCVEMNFT
jgi:hypothetical protein